MIGYKTFPSDLQIERQIESQRGFVACSF
jgi:hypothetical protein